MQNIGDRAPNFTLKYKNGNEESLSDFRGKRIVLYFYPKVNPDTNAEEILKNL